MDIVIGRTAPVDRARGSKREPSDTAKKKRQPERRKNKQDRRKSVRDGVIVTLSTKKDRRRNKDRRKNN